MDEERNNRDLEKEIAQSRKERNAKLSKLNCFDKEYNSDKFMADLESYFEGEVDFNLERIKKEIEQEGKLQEIIEKALQKDTHPVVEFVKDLMKDLNQEDK